VADPQLSFPVEEIPDADPVFMRAHCNLLRDGEIVPGVFRAHDAGMSVDWSKYATPEDTRLRARKPLDNAVIALIVGEIRAKVGLAVHHSPQSENQAHSDVILPEDDEDLTEARIKLGRIASFAIPLGG
jgi:hypothetical protein